MEEVEEKCNITSAVISQDEFSTQRSDKKIYGKLKGDETVFIDEGN